MDRTAFTNALGQYQGTVYRLALHLLCAPADAEDAVQEVFLRLYTCRKDFESEAHLRRWLLRVTANHCRDLLKSPWRKRRVDLDSIPEQAVFDHPEDGELYRAVMALPQLYRAVLYLFYYEDLPTQEIAQVLGLRQSAVTTRLSRARAMLKETLKEGWNND